MFAALLMLAAVQAAASPATPADDPLAPARAGKLRCVNPDPTRRNCASLIRFQVHGDGSFDATVTGMLEPSVLIVYETSGQIDGQAVCSPVRISDFTSGQFFVDGKPATAAQAGEIKERLLARMRDITGKRRCFIDQPAGGGIVSNVTIEGAVHPEMRQQVAWVAPSDGYAIGE